MISALDPPEGLRKRQWSVEVNATADPTLAVAARDARKMLVVVAAAALTLGFGLVITVRAARASAEVTLMRSDFVSTVTHELKTPVSVVRGIGETLIRGRVTTPERLHEYAQLLVQEGHRLSLLIDNLLAYSRVTDVAAVYSLEPHRPVDVAQEAAKGFHRLLHESGFKMEFDVLSTLPMIRADRTALVLALNNLIDNAIRYSGSAREVLLRAVPRDGCVEFAVSDRGQGIAPEDLARVQQRFVRGRSANGHGSGLGLAIVSRIARDHGGEFRIESTADAGTTAILAIPVVEA
jgi:two-component system phosphate regulon sensor histidine kinase PhoR